MPTITVENLILKSIKLGVLNELFTELLSDLPKNEIKVTSADGLSAHFLLSNISDGDLLITNAEFEKDTRNYSVLQKDGLIILTIDCNGNVNNRDNEFYLEQDYLIELERLFNKIRISNSLYTVVLDD